MAFSNRKKWEAWLISYLVTQYFVVYLLSHVWLCNPMDCSSPGFSTHGISQAKMVEKIAISFSRGSYQPRDPIPISCIGRWILYHSASREVLAHTQVIQVHLYLTEISHTDHHFLFCNFLHPFQWTLNTNGIVALPKLLSMDSVSTFLHPRVM